MQVEQRSEGFTNGLWNPESGLLGNIVRKPVQGIGYHLQDHLQYEYMAKCKKPVTANNLIWNLFPRELYRWYKDPMTSQLQCTMVPGFGFRKLEPGDDEPGVQHHFLPASFNNHGQSQGLKKMNSFLRGR